MVNNRDRVSRVFAALADPTRRRMLERLARYGESPVTKLAEPFSISPPAVTKHLRVLENAYLVRRRKQGREHLIRTDPAGIGQVRKWIAHCAAGWQSSFDALDELLAEQRKEKDR
jgi:DNA-binding transcriptional ArsR family regulator